MQLSDDLPAPAQDNFFSFLPHTESALPQVLEGKGPDATDIRDNVGVPRPACHQADAIFKGKHPQSPSVSSASEHDEQLATVKGSHHTSSECLITFQKCPLLFTGTCSCFITEPAPKHTKLTILQPDIPGTSSALNMSTRSMARAIKHACPSSALYQA